MRRRSTSPRSRWALSLAVGVMLVPLTASAATYNVKAVGDEWSPEVRKILKGDRVTWKNPTNTTHDVSAIGSKWDLDANLAPGEQVSKRFRNVGRYRYRCTVHSAMIEGRCEGMCGVVVVRRP